MVFSYFVSASPKEILTGIGENSLSFSGLLFSDWDKSKGGGALKGEAFVGVVSILCSDFA